MPAADGSTATSPQDIATFEKTRPSRRKLYDEAAPRLARFLLGTETTDAESDELMGLKDEHGDDALDYVAELARIWRSSGVWHGTGDRPERGDVVERDGVEVRVVGVGTMIVVAHHFDDFEPMCEQFDRFRARELAGETIDVSYFQRFWCFEYDLGFDVPSTLAAHDVAGEWKRSSRCVDGTTQTSRWRVDLPLTRKSLDRARRLRAIAQDLVDRTANHAVARWLDDTLIETVVRALLVAIGPVSSIRQLASWFGFEVRGVHMTFSDDGGRGFYGDDMTSAMLSSGFANLGVQDQDRPCLVAPLRIDPSSDEWRDYVAFAIGTVVARWIGCPRFYEEHLWAARVGRMLVVPDEVIASAILVDHWYPYEVDEDGDIMDESLDASDIAALETLELEVAKRPRLVSLTMAKQRFQEERGLPNKLERFTSAALAAAERSHLYAAAAE